jgi:predicted RNase H-like nuclease
VPFLDALAAHRDGPAWPLPIEEPTLELRYRATDEFVHELPFVNRRPLSVSADRIAVPAMRCAAILAQIADQTDPREVARDGSGLCCEVYPDPALRFWTDDGEAGLAGASYKRPKNSKARVALLEAIHSQLPIRDPAGRLALVEREDDYLDALVCALVARAAERDLTHPPDEEQRKLALVEGWIHVPSAPLAALAG